MDYSRYQGRIAAVTIALLVLMAGAAGAFGAESYDPHGRRDPFGPLVRDGKLIVEPKGPTKPQILLPVLSGILWDAAGQSIALLNDTEARVGDTIAGEYRVTAITAQSVTVEREAQTTILSLDLESTGGRP